jgi:hypothetical protein
MSTTNKQFLIPEITRAANILDSPHGLNSCGDGQIEYPSSQELVRAGADIVSLAKVKTTRLPDYPQYTYEFLFEQCYGIRNAVAFSQVLAAAPDVPKILEIVRGVFASTQCWAMAMESARLAIAQG